MKLALVPFAILAMSGCERKQKEQEPGQTENLATISLNKTSTVLVIGHNETLTASVANGSGDVTWASSNSAVATVGANGEVTAVAKGTATITASYSGKSTTCTVVVKNINDVYVLTSVQQNANIKEFLNNAANTQNEFKGTTSNILEVGDDNPVQLKPVLKLVDIDTMDEVPQEAWEYDYELKLEKYEDSAYVETAEDFGTFDAKECTFDFNDAAKGKQFKLTVIPGGLNETQKAKAENRKTVEVKVFEGYNVYSEKELAYANDIEFHPQLRQSNDGIIADINQAWKDFRVANNLNETYVANAIYLQSSLKLKKEHLPSAFFFTEAESNGHPEWVGKMKDATDVYCHYARGYTFNGNYFNIDTSLMPLAVDNLDYNDNVSHCTLFKTALFEQINPDPGYVDVLFKNCSYYGNSPRGNIAEDSMGLIFFKIRNEYYHYHGNNLVIRGTFENFNITRACISFFGECGPNQLVIKDCIVSEGYSNAIYLWDNGNVDFINSEMRNFGGPIIITDGDGEDDSQRRTLDGFHVTADAATILDNKVTGVEPWFTNTMGGLPAQKMTDIKGLNQVVQLGSAGAKSFVSGENQEMNMIIINYGEIPFLTFQKGDGQTIGIDEQSGVKRATVEGYLGAGAPILNTDNGGMGFWDGTQTMTCYHSLSDDVPLGGNYLDVIHRINPVPGFPDNNLFLSIIFGL